MDWSLVAGPAHFFRLLGSHFFPLFFLSSNNAQRNRGKLLEPTALSIGVSERETENENRAEKQQQGEQILGGTETSSMT